MKKVKSNRSIKFVLQEQPRTPESGIIQVWLKQQQQFGYTPDLIGGMTFFEFQRSNPGAATLTGTGISLVNCTGKLLVLGSVGTIGGGSISCQMQSCTSTGGAGAASAGAAFGTAAGPFQFQLDLEAFAAGFARSVVTIVTGSTPICIVGMAFTKLV